jgi:SulP family sulfate permease
MSVATRLTKKVPGAIIGLVAGIATYFVLAAIRPELRQLAGNGLVVGPIQASGSFLEGVSLRLSSFLKTGSADLLLVLGPALTLSVLLSIDTLKTGVVLDALTRRRHNSNRELIAQGVANATSSLSGGVPGAGTMGPTLINVTSGGRTPWSGVIEGVLVLAGFLALGKVLAWVPISALAGILLVIAWRMFDFHMFKLLLTPSARLDFLVIISVVIVAETVGLIQASAVGIGLAIILFIRNQVRGSVFQHKLSLQEVRSKRRRSPEEMALLKKHGDQAILVQLKDDLFFGTTDQLFSQLEADLATRRFILLDFRRVTSMDYTAAHLLEQMNERLRERGGQLLFSGMPSSLPSRQDLENYMAQLGTIGEESGISIFDTRDSALEWMEERILESAGWRSPAEDVPLALNEIEIFRTFDENAIRQLARSVERVVVPEGEKVFSAGEKGDKIYFVSLGRVDILLPLQSAKRHHVATIGRGEFFGEMAFLDQHVRSAIAEAATDTELFVISRQAFDDSLKGDEALAARFFEHLAYAIAQRLRLADSELTALEER